MGLAALGVMTVATTAARADGMPEGEKFVCDIRSYHPAIPTTSPGEERLMDAISDVNRSSEVINGLFEIKEILLKILENIPSEGEDPRLIQRLLNEVFPTGWLHCSMKDEEFEKPFKPIADVIAYAIEHNQLISWQNIHFIIQTIEAIKPTYIARHADDILIAELTLDPMTNPDQLIASRERAAAPRRFATDIRPNVHDHRGERQHAVDTLKKGRVQLASAVTTGETTFLKEIHRIRDSGIISLGTLDTHIATALPKNGRPWVLDRGASRETKRALDALYAAHEDAPLSRLLLDERIAAAFERIGARPHAALTRAISDPTRAQFVGEKEVTTKCADALCGLDECYRAEIATLREDTRDSVRLVIDAQPQNGFDGMTLIVPELARDVVIAETAGIEDVFAVMRERLRETI